MSMPDDPAHGDVPDYAKTDQIPYYDGPYYEYVPASQRRAYPVSVPVAPQPQAPYGVPHIWNAAAPTWSGMPAQGLVPFSHPPQQRGWSKQTRALVIACAIVMVGVIAGGSYALFMVGRSLVQQQVTSVTRQAVFTPGDCPFTPGRGIVEGKDVKCGTLTVPENRSQPQGRMIRLAVAIFKAPQTSSSATPVLYLTGGPGGGALADLGRYINSANRDEIMLGQDLIVLDQRGTGYSEPALNCWEFGQIQRDTQDQQDSTENDIALNTQAAQQCKKRLTASGVDLSAYTTIENAADVHDLIHVLGYQQVNLYGVSYGTRLALTVMRLFPHDLRAVVLDSTVPTQLNLFNTFPSVTQHAYDTLFQGCSADATCNSKYPRLQETFYRLVKDLNANPVKLQDSTYGELLLTGDGFAGWLFNALYVTAYIPYLPQIINEASQGEYGMLSRMYGPLVMQGSISEGMYYSVECGEDIAFTTLSQLEAATQQMREEIKPSMLANLQSSYAICQVWGQKPVPAEQKQAVKSSIPTLILSGEYDPITPTSNAELAARTLSNSHVLVFPATGHGVFLTGACPDAVIKAFWGKPSGQPQSVCIPTMGEPDFA